MPFRFAIFRGCRVSGERNGINHTCINAPWLPTRCGRAMEESLRPSRRSQMNDEIKSRSDGTAENRSREQGELPPLCAAATRQQPRQARRRNHHLDPQPGGSQGTRGDRGNGPRNRVQRFVPAAVAPSPFGRRQGSYSPRGICTDLVHNSTETIDAPRQSNAETMRLRVSEMRRFQGNQPETADRCQRVNYAHTTY